MACLLIEKERVKISPYYLTWRHGFRLVGFIEITPYISPPQYQTWDLPVYNRFCSIATKAVVDDKTKLVLPCFINDQVQPDLLLDGETDRLINVKQPWLVFFLGNDDTHYGLRFNDATERQASLETFGQELGLLHQELIFHN